MSNDKLQEIKRDYADVLSKQSEVSDVFTGNTDDFVWLIERLEQAQATNQKLVESLKTIKTYTRSTFQNEGNKLLRIEEVATEALSEVKGNVGDS